MADQYRAARAIVRHATDPQDAAELMAALGIDPDIFRLRWSRTGHLGAAGSVTLSIDLDLRQVSAADREFVVGLVRLVRDLSALHQEPQQ